MSSLRPLTMREILELAGALTDLAQPLYRFVSFRSHLSVSRPEPLPRGTKMSGKTRVRWLFALSRSSVLNVLATTFAEPLPRSLLKKLRGNQMLPFVAQRGYGLEYYGNGARSCLQVKRA